MNLALELKKASNLLDANIDLPGYLISARRFKLEIDTILLQLESDKNIDMKKLSLMFAPTTPWDDLSHQMSVKDSKLANSIANNILELCG